MKRADNRREPARGEWTIENPEWVLIDEDCRLLALKLRGGIEPMSREGLRDAHEQADANLQAEVERRRRDGRQPAA